MYCYEIKVIMRSKKSKICELKSHNYDIKVIIMRF